MLQALDPAPLPDDAIEIARIAGAWGVKGWLKIQPYSAQPEALFSSKRWYLQPPEKGPQPFAGTLLLRVREAREHGGGVVASIDGIDDKDAADALKASRLFVSRTSFPTADQDEYYWVDLIGLDVVNREGVALGTVRELLATGPQTVLVLDASEATADGATKTVERMIPFVSAFVDGVDLPARRITVDWQPDY
ncbi:ribosome maturation factor RimM [Pseudorhodoferax sp. Leaf267]|uniref:ribosome maturation factor RimM n=1 Tax=Pseudorhodoferax sp. Leaf267 TaxID=1736316 RepID=UPI0006F99504|nr:ribosome maturation factor RimM [Pseudorhodoferax sp. Leaf267]KQP17941.1 16S rRNA processing protein RimM [Pseudorhodoferax sp. Leaf267]